MNEKKERQHQMLLLVLMF